MSELSICLFSIGNRQLSLAYFCIQNSNTRTIGSKESKSIRSHCGFHSLYRSAFSVIRNGIMNRCPNFMIHFNCEIHPRIINDSLTFIRKLNSHFWFFKNHSVNDSISVSVVPLPFANWSTIKCLKWIILNMCRNHFFKYPKIIYLFWNDFICRFHKWSIRNVYSLVEIRYASIDVHIKKKSE